MAVAFGALANAGGLGPTHRDRPLLDHELRVVLTPCAEKTISASRTNRRAVAVRD